MKHPPLWSSLLAGLATTTMLSCSAGVGGGGDSSSPATEPAPADPAAGETDGGDKKGGDDTSTKTKTKTNTSTSTATSSNSGTSTSTDTSTSTSTDSSTNTNTGTNTGTTDTTPPDAPVVGGDTPADPNSPAPKWTWVSGGNGGSGTFRYKLDNSNLISGATETTNLELEEIGLSVGNHTLYVQERDAAGNWSTHGSHQITVALCPAGSYCPGAPDVTTPCPAGRYCEEGSKTALGTAQCPANFYCPEGSATPTACAYGTTAALGSDEATDCTGSAPTAFYLSCDGADAGTTFTDPYGHTISTLAATTSTAQKRMGSASCYLDGVSPGAWLTVAASPDFGFGTGDFMIEGWLYTTDTSLTNQMIFDTRSTSTSQPWGACLPFAGDPNNFHFWDGSTAVTSSATTLQDTWTHLAVSRRNGTIRIFKDGILTGSGAMATNLGVNETLFIGNYFAENYPVKGYMDEIRVVKGKAAYISNFQPSIDSRFHDAQQYKDTQLSATAQTDDRIAVWRDDRFALDAIAPTLTARPTKKEVTHRGKTFTEVRLNGGDQYLELQPGDWHFDPDTAFTISLVVNPISLVNFPPLVMNKDDGGINGWSLYVNGFAGNVLEFAMHDGSTFLAANSTRAIVAGKPQVIVATYDGSGSGAGMKIYVNGREGQNVYSGSGTLSSPIVSPAPARIGYSKYNSNYFDGGFVEISTYRYAMDESEAGAESERLNAQVAAFCPNGYYCDPTTTNGTICPDDTYCEYDATSPTACPVGTFSPQGSDDISDCI